MKLEIKGGVRPFANPRVISGSLPLGVTLEIVDRHIVFVGRPTAPGEGHVEISVTDKNNKVITSSMPWKVNPPPGWPPMMTRTPKLWFDGTTEMLLTADGRIRRWHNKGELGGYLEQKLADAMPEARTEGDTRYAAFDGADDCLIKSDGLTASLNRNVAHSWVICVVRKHALDVNNFPRPIVTMAGANSNPQLPRVQLGFSDRSMKNGAVFASTKVDNTASTMSKHDGHDPTQWHVLMGVIDRVRGVRELRLNGEVVASEVIEKGLTSDTPAAVPNLILGGGFGYADVDVAMMIADSGKGAVLDEVYSLEEWAVTGLSDIV